MAAKTGWLKATRIHALRFTFHALRFTFLASPYERDFHPIKSVQSVKSVVSNTPIPIIGASVAGLSAAYHLARGGMRVRVYEAQTPFEPAERTLIVTPAFLRLMDGGSEEVVLNRIAAFELISAHCSVRIPLGEPDVVLDRAALLRLLARRVQEAGGEILFGHRLTEVHRDRSISVLRFSIGENRERLVPAPCMVGADGVHSAAARAVGSNGLRRVGLAQARVSLPPDLPPDTTRVWFDRTTTRFFYWLIPESPRVGAAGVIAESPEEARRLLERFLSAQGLELLDWQQGAEVPLFPLRPGRVPNGDGRVLLVGDAAGQVKVTTVGGVVTGIRGGLAAARALLRRTSYGAEVLPLQHELTFHAIVRQVLDGFTDGDYDRLLELLNGRALAVLSRRHRDELAWALWPLLLSQPRWLLLGARALVRGFQGCLEAHPERR